MSTIQAANNGITSITKLVQSAQSLVSQAQQTTDPTVRSGLATQFDAVLGQITQLARDASFNGINLLDSTHQRQPDRHAERKRLFERHRQCGQLHRDRPHSQQFEQRLGQHGRHLRWRART